MEVQTTLAEDGHILIPLEYCQTLGIQPGDELHLHLVGGVIHILTQEQVIDQEIAELQELVREYLPRAISLVEDLIAERRRKAAKQDSE